LGLVVVTVALIYQHLNSSGQPTSVAGESGSTTASQPAVNVPGQRPSPTSTDAKPQSPTPDQEDGPGLVRLVSGVLQDTTRVFDDVFQDFAGLTAEEEKRIGDKVHLTLLAQNDVLTEESARLTRLAQPLLRNTRHRTFEYTFTAIDSPQFNAFAHIGGHIYFYKGLLDVAENDEELLFVLAHEIGHVERGHCARHAAYAKASREMGGDMAETIAQLVYTGISRGYSEDLELEADEWSYNTLRSQGLQHDSIISFLFKMAAVESKHQRGGASDDDSIASVIGDHFRTHPPTSLRIRQVETLRHQY